MPIPPERRRRLALLIQYLRRTADTAGEVLAGKYPEDTAGYLRGALANAQADLQKLARYRRSRAA